MLLWMYFTYCYGSFFFLSWLQTYLVRGRGFSEKDLLLSTFPFILGALANLSWRIFQRRSGSTPRLEERPPDHRHGGA